MSLKKFLTGSPNGCVSTFDDMLDILLSLLPAAIAGVLFFGFRAALLLFCCVASAALCEWGISRILPKAANIKDLSAVVTGLLVGMCMPSTVPLPVAILITVSATVIPRVFFGGHGCEIVSPAAFGAILTAVSFPTIANSFSDAFSGLSTASTPLNSPAGTYSYSQLLFGAHGGAIGEVGSLFLILGGLYLVFRRVASPAIILSAIFTAIIAALIFGQSVSVTVFGGGLLLGVIFMATARTTSPQNLSGQLAFGVFIGFLTVVLRKYASVDEGVYFAICAACLLRPLFSAIPEINIGGGKNENA